jgi:hypothetical protein
VPSLRAVTCRTIVAVAVAIAAVSSRAVVSSAGAQDVRPAGTAVRSPADSGARLLRVFFDCPIVAADQYIAACQGDFFTQTLTFVSWTRDRIDADVHVLGRAIATGGGGIEFTLAFIGRGRYQGRTDTLVVTTIPNESEGDVRTKLSDALKSGLYPFLRGTAGASQLKLVVAGGGEPPKADPKTLKDPWNFWIFNVGLWGNGNGEARVKGTFVNLNASATRVTESLRLLVSTDGGYNDQRFSFPGQATSVNILRNYNLNARAVKALDSHWSWGAMTRVSQSDFANKRLGLRVAPVVEYNVFPWAQATTQQLTFGAAAGYARFQWIDTTIFDRAVDSRPFSQVVGAFSNRESWGSNSVRVLYQNFLDDPAKYRMSINGEVDLRIAKGLSINLWGEYSSIRDQINLARAGATRDQVLVRQRALATNYQYWFGVGINYAFGSIYNTVVNQRLERFFLQGF